MFYFFFLQKNRIYFFFIVNFVPNKNKIKKKYFFTTYEVCIKEEEFLLHFNWNVVVVDEAHRLKNRNSRLACTFLFISYGILYLKKNGFFFFKFFLQKFQI
eukprot:GSMAST32.ASY1.ANO1.1016.1 assembled CDS